MLRRAHHVAPLAAILLAACGSRGESPVPSPSPTESTRFITDAQGRALVLRGINTNNRSKSDPLRSPGLTDGDIDRIARHWGFNLVRYLVLWDALEPEPGKIDGAYIDRIAEDVARLGRAGVRVMLDMHQDVYAAKFCCDGAPAWAIRDDGQPFEQKDLWALNYMQPAVQRAFDNFWAAEGPNADLQQHYAAAWQALAKRFAADANVVGYDLINEPFAGSDFDPVEALFRKSPEDGGTSKTFDETKLGPFYQRMLDAIRQVDSDHWVFFEPRYGAPGNGSPSYLPKLRDPRAGGPRIVYAPHLYSSSAEAAEAFRPNDPTVSLWEKQRTAELEKTAWPMLLGEWWAFKASDPNAPWFVEQILAMADRMQMGWAYWSYDPGSSSGPALFDEDGTDNPIADVVIRPYPRAIAGEPTSFAYDPVARTFELEFTRRDGVTGPTEIFLPTRAYPNGFDVQLSTDPGGSFTFDADAGVVSVTTDPAVTLHHLRIVPTP